MRINTNYLDRFIRSNNGYLYPVCNGIYLKFDLDTLEFMEIEMYFTPKYIIDKYAEKKLSELYSKGLLI